ncbi:MAG TPA: arginine--tRNA ligase [Acidimicrobiia bacterium]|nr:arginine--tRNA ligase [Acidimicrobiia bacterium]
MSLLSELSVLVGEAFAAEGLDPAHGEVVVSQRPELAQFQCNGAMAAARVVGAPPRELAGKVASRLGAHPHLAAVDIAGPGFINLTISDDWLAAVTQRAVDDPRLGVPASSEPSTVLVDYGGPNVAKAMHVGHLRATIIGDSLARLFSFLGHKVIRDPHFGDWGLQMGLVMAEIERRRPELAYFVPEFTGPFPEEPPVTLEDLQEIYPVAAARAETDPAWAERARLMTVELQQGRPGYVALWQQMKRVSEESQRADFARLGVEFDLWYGESDVADRMEPLVRRLLEQGVAEESRGAVIIRVDQPGEKRELPPLILETSLGGYLYSTSDLATIEMRVDDLGVDLALYVVDARQSDHFEQLFRAARVAGIAPPEVRLEHIKFGTMNGKDGKPFKTRAGGVVSLSDLIDLIETAASARLAEAEIAEGYPEAERKAIARQVGVAALKFGDLINNRASDYIFDLDRFSSFEGKTGPYLQYGAVRIRSIQRRAAGRDLPTGPILPPVQAADRELMLELARLPEIMGRAAELRAPNHLAEYAFVLASAWNRFYDHCHILDEADPSRQASWLSLAHLTLRALTLLLDLLGIEVPERM